MRATGHRGDGELHERQVAIFDIDDGAVSEATFIYEDPDTYDAFWA